MDKIDSVTPWKKGKVEGHALRRDVFDVLKDG